MKKPRIGDVQVVKGRPPSGNPYRATGLMGDERADALRALRLDQDVSSYTFWCVPASGGAYEIANAREIDWIDLRELDGSYSGRSEP